MRGSENLSEVSVNAPITGTVLEVEVSPGDVVSRDDVLVVIEAMKMENEVLCDYDGKVVSVNAVVGVAVSEGDTLLTLAVG